jgi:hypothetical protein
LYWVIVFEIEEIEPRRKKKYIFTIITNLVYSDTTMNIYRYSSKLEKYNIFNVRSIAAILDNVSFCMTAPVGLEGFVNINIRVLGVMTFRKTSGSSNQLLEAVVCTKIGIAPIKYVY